MPRSWYPRMTRYDPDHHHRRSIRLKDYDYTQAGAYFVTICTWEREYLFGEVIDGLMSLNAYGQIVEDEWLKTAVIRRQVELDGFVIMPNHIHAIVVFTPPTGEPVQSLASHPKLKRDPASLGALIAGFKAAVTRQINKLRRKSQTAVWHRNYYEHVIRSDHALQAVREYIIDNPARWHLDRYNAAANERDPQAIALWDILKNQDRGALLQITVDRG